MVILWVLIDTTMTVVYPGGKMNDMKTKVLIRLRRVRWEVIGPYLALCAWALYLRLTDG